MWTDEVAPHFTLQGEKNIYYSYLMLRILWPTRPELELYYNAITDLMGEKKSRIMPGNFVQKHCACMHMSKPVYSL